MILDLFIYIIQFYINQNTFLPGFIIRKEGLRTAKRVVIKDNQIVYGPYKEKVKYLDLEGTTYIELIPTIDYLDSRLEMSPDGRLLLFSSNKTFSQLVSQVNYDILHGGNISDVTNELETGTAWLWLLLNGKLLSSISDERSKRLAYGILTEENKDNFIVRNRSAFVDFCSTVSGVADVSSAISEMGDLDFFDESIKKASDRVGLVSEVVGVASDFLGMSVNLEMQIKQLYLRNIENTKNTLLNKKMGILESKNALYKNLSFIVKEYDEKSKNNTNELFLKLYTNEAFSFLMDAGAEGMVSKTILKYFPAIDAGLSLLKVYGDISGVTDGASSIVEQQDYVSLQSKVAIKLNEYHDLIKKGKKFSKEDIINYVELARMYYHVKTAYYHMYNEYHPDPLFEDGYKTYLDIEREIDQYGDSVYTLDVPNINSTKLQNLTFPEKKGIELTEIFEMKDFSSTIYLPQDIALNNYQVMDGSTLSYIWNYVLYDVYEIKNRNIQINIIESFQPYDGIQRTRDEFIAYFGERPVTDEYSYLGNQTKFVRIRYLNDLVEGNDTSIPTTVVKLDFENVETDLLITYSVDIAIEDCPENIDENDINFVRNLALKIAESCTMF